MDIFNWLQGAGGAFVILTASKLYDMFKDWRKTKTETEVVANESKSKTQLAELEAQNKIDLAINEQAIQIYKDNVANLQANIASLMTKIEKLEGEHMTCREENAQANAKITILEAKVQNLELRLSSTASSS